VHAEKSQEELSSKIQYQEQQIQLLEKERLNLRDQIAFLQTTVQNKEREWKERLTEAETELEGKERLLEQYREESNAQGREAQNVRQELLSEQDKSAKLEQQLAEQVQASSVFGASLSSSFMSSADTQVKIVTVAMIIIMSVTQWYTMAQLSMKNMSTDSLNSDNPMIRSQRMMLYVMPVIFAVSGVHFQIGVLVYWVVSNLWTMGQQFFTIRNMPAPGSEAEKKYRARINAKRARKGLPSLEEEERAEAIAKAEAEGRTGGQRVQPVRKNRQKKSGGQGESRSEDVADDSDVEQLEDTDEDKDSTSSKSGGLSDEEIARRRYERRARQRREAAARRKAQAKKKRNR